MWIAIELLLCAFAGFTAGVPFGLYIAYRVMLNDPPHG